MKDRFDTKRASKPCLLVARDFFSLHGTRALRVPQYKHQQYCTDLLLTVRTTRRSDLGMLPLYWEYGTHFFTRNNEPTAGQGHTITTIRSIVQKRRMASIVR
jgi:hypothetical protein